MKKILATLLLFCAGAMATHAAAQTVTMTGKSQSKVVLTWQIPAPSSSWLGCVAGQPNCTFRPFSIAGTCPAILVGSTGWSQLTDTGNNATTATDTAPGADSSGNVSYVVKTVQSGLTSDPSNCTTVKLPNAPGPATALGATAG